MTTRYLVFTTLWFVMLAGILFAAGGDLRWPEAWVFAAEYIVCSGAVVVWLGRHDPALLRERFAAPVHRDQSLWDRIFILTLIPVFVGWLVLMGLDGRRFGWSHVPVALEVVGALALAASMFFTWLVFRANSFAVPQARLQAQRAQSVIDTGPYAYVRHPMYSGGIFFFVGLALLLGSWLGLIAVPLFIVAIGARAVGEERMLRRGLDGYDVYASRVRWRLVPGVW